MKRCVRTLFGSALLLGATATSAALVFSDDFDADTTALNKTDFLGGWTVADGSVDLVDFAFGRLVDLDGSTRDAGLFSKALDLSAGLQYTATFELAGSQRGSTETVDVTFGSSSASYTLASADPLAARALVFTPMTSGEYVLRFANTGGDNVGALLDNVSVTAIPEPAAAALMLAGLVVVPLVACRRRLRGRL